MSVTFNKLVFQSTKHIIVVAFTLLVGFHSPIEQKSNTAIEHSQKHEDSQQHLGDDFVGEGFVKVKVVGAPHTLSLIVHNDIPVTHKHHSLVYLRSDIVFTHAVSDQLIWPLQI